MMRKFLLILFCSFPALLQAQLTISVQLPAGGMIQQDQLWNLVVMNGSNRNLDAVLLLSLQDVSTGQTVLTGSTRSIVLPAGAKSLRVADLQPIQYNNYGAAGMSGTYIPLGAYTACYTISKVTSEMQEPIASECVRININPLSPPLLNLPADKSQVATPYPQFSWMPPAPLNMFTDLSYELNVVEVLEGQSPAEAISNNSPVYSRSMLQSPYESYATSYSPLEKNKTYGWQVTARNGMNYAAATEVWTFNMKGDSTDTEGLDKSYIELKPNQPSGAAYPLSSHEIRLKYYSYGSAFKGVFRFYNNANALVKEVTRDIVYGDNYLSISLDKSFEKDIVYKAEFIDEQKKKSSFTFIIQ
jgi:hypothetical protein